MGKGDGWKGRRTDMMEGRARGKAGRVIPWAVGPWKPAVFRIREGRGPAPYPAGSEPLARTERHGEVWAAAGDPDVHSPCAHGLSCPPWASVSYTQRRAERTCSCAQQELGPG